MTIRLEELIDWYTGQCDGLWEHQHYGIKIATLDNPGLRLRIDLSGTTLEHKRFEKIEYNLESEDEWLVCEKTKDGFFEGACAPALFGRLVDLFLNWEEETEI